MAQHNLEQSVQSTEHFSKDLVRDYPDGGFDLALMDKALLPAMRSSGKNINPSVLAFWLGFTLHLIAAEAWINHPRPRAPFSGSVTARIVRQARLR